MKNVLLTTTALVAFAGAAVAGDISWTGSASIEYDVVDTSFSYDADIDFKYTQELNNGASAYLSYGADLGTGALVWDALPVIGLDTSYGSISAGAIDNVNGGDDADANDAFVSGMIVGDALNEIGFGAQTHLVRANTTVGGINVAASTDAGGDTIAANVTGSMGTVDFALYYGKSTDTVAGAAAFSITNGVNPTLTGDRSGTSLGLTVSTEFSGLSVDVAYASGEYSGTFDGFNYNLDSGTSVGIALGYALTDAVSVSASHAVNTYGAGATADLGLLNGTLVGTADDLNNLSDTQTAVGIAYAANNITASLDYDVDAQSYEVAAGYTMAISADTTAVIGVAMVEGADATFSIDVAHVSGDLAVYAGYNSKDEDTYAGVSYDLGNGAAAYAYYSDSVVGAGDSDLGPLNWDTGTIIGVSVAF